MLLEREQGRFVKGNQYSLDTEFKKGQHWREPKQYWDKEWLYKAYVLERRSAKDIASEFECNENNILYFLNKHNISIRTMSEIRKKKKWGASGSANGMYGRCGKDNPQWKGGITPERQAFYISEEWKKVRSDVWIRDEANCQRCNIYKEDYNDNFHIHHIVSFEVVELRAVLSNLILFCKDCHIWVHSKKNVEGMFIENV